MYASKTYNGDEQYVANSHVGGYKTKDFDPSYIEKQKNILSQQKQAQLGKIPIGIKRTSHVDPIQSAIYGFNNQEIDLSENNTSLDEYHKFDPTYDYLNKSGLLKENIKYKLNTIQLNIDSSTRKIDPHVTHDAEIKLNNNPLSFESVINQIGVNNSKSNLLVVNCPGHNFVKGDRFTLGGISNESISIQTKYTNINNQKINAVKFTSGSTAVQFSSVFQIETSDGTNLAKYDTHFKVGLNTNYSVLKNYDTSQLKVKINGFTGLKGSFPGVGNIPINFLNSSHQIYLTNPDPTNLISPFINVPDASGNVKINGFYILLDVPYVGTDPTIPYVLTLQFNHYGGVPLNQLNAEFPIDADHAFGYHEVFSVTEDTIITKINNVAYYYDETKSNVQSAFGGNSVYIAKITNLTYGYNSPNSYVVELPRSIHNIISVKLISTTIPNTSKIIRDTPTNNNNMLYWQNQDDGDITYSIALESGNYTPETLKSTIEQKVYNTPRFHMTETELTSTSYTQVNFMKIDINTDTNVVTFKSYKEALLKNPIINISPSIDDTGGEPPYTITIKQHSHGLQIGNTVLLSGLISTYGIPDTVLNSTHVITAKNHDDYSFVIDNFNLYNGTRAKIQGGVAGKAYVPINFKLLFNSSDTFGSLLGFRNVGDDIATTPFKSVISNVDPYDNEIVFTETTGYKYVYNKSGNKSLLTSNNIKLSGYDYVLLSIEELNTATNFGTHSTKYFAKINLSGLPGQILYDTFVPTSNMTYDPIDISKLTIKFFAPDGSLFDFNGVDHSFVLEITTENATNIESGIVSNRTIF